MIASWRWKTDDDARRVVETAIRLSHKINQRSDHYQCRFGTKPEFRVGIHGGEVVVSEQGDLRRSIEYNGDGINIAARMEEKAKQHVVTIAFTEPVADCLAEFSPPPKLLGDETVKGISQSIRVFTLDP